MLAFFKNAKNFVGVGFDKPLFKGIYFDGKRVMATNTHVLIIATNFPSEERIIDYKTGELIEGKYPNVDKVIPEKTENNIDVTNITEWINALKTSMAVASKFYGYMVYLNVTDGVLRLKTESMDYKFEATLPTQNITGNMPNIHFSAKYMRDILIFFKDANVGKFTLGYNNPLQAMKLTADKEVMAVLTPIRVN